MEWEKFLKIESYSQKGTKKLKIWVFEILVAFVAFSIMNMINFV